MLSQSHGCGSTDQLTRQKRVSTQVFLLGHTGLRNSRPPPTPFYAPLSWHWLTYASQQVFSSQKQGTKNLDHEKDQSFPQLSTQHNAQLLWLQETSFLESLQNLSTKSNLQGAEETAQQLRTQASHRRSDWFPAPMMGTYDSRLGNLLLPSNFHGHLYKSMRARAWAHTHNK